MVLFPSLLKNCLFCLTIVAAGRFHTRQTKKHESVLGRDKDATHNILERLEKAKEKMEQLEKSQVFAQQPRQPIAERHPACPARERQCNIIQISHETQVTIRFENKRYECKEPVSFKTSGCSTNRRCLNRPSHQQHREMKLQATYQCYAKHNLDYLYCQIYQDIDANFF